MSPFKVLSGPLYDFNGDYGFDYRPSADIIQVVVSNTGVHECHRIQINRLGNTAASDETFSDDALNILVVGDSFTCDPGSGEPEWPELLKQRLPYKTRILNYGRASTGVLQMFDRAKVVVERFKPDLIIFAFVSRHIDRARRYLSTRVDGKVTRSIIHLESSPAPHEYSDFALVDYRVTPDWAARAGQNDPVLRDLIQRRAEHTARVSNGFDIVSMSSFAEDSRFMENLEAIKSIPTLYVHLPEAKELQTGYFAGRSKFSVDLLRSLEGLTGEPLHLLGGYLSRQSPEAIQTRYARASYDFHPSLWAKNLYADHIADLVKARLPTI